MKFISAILLICHQAVSTSAFATWTSSSSVSFITSTSTSTSTLTSQTFKPNMNMNINMNMVGGKGWDNNSFLDSLDGDEADREEQTENYEKFSESRKEHLQRQQQQMDDPRVQQFMSDRNNRRNRDEADFDLNKDFNPLLMNTGDDIMADITPNKDGGTRFKDMMQKAKRLQQEQQSGHLPNEYLNDNE